MHEDAAESGPNLLLPLVGNELYAQTIEFFTGFIGF